jgi:hypothetical protein
MNDVVDRDFDAVWDSPSRFVASTPNTGLARWGRRVETLSMFLPRWLCALTIRMLRRRSLSSGAPHRPSNSCWPRGSHRVYPFPACAILSSSFTVEKALSRRSSNGREKGRQLSGSREAYEVLKPAGQWGAEATSVSRNAPPGKAHPRSHERMQAIAFVR